MLGKPYNLNGGIQCVQSSRLCSHLCCVNGHYEDIMTRCLGIIYITGPCNVFSSFYSYCQGRYDYNRILAPFL